MKQTSKQRYLKFYNFMNMSGFSRCEVDHGCYLEKLSSFYINVMLNVDVVLIVGSDMQKINELKIRLTREFKIINQRDAKLKNVLSMLNSEN